LYLIRGRHGLSSAGGSTACRPAALFCLGPAGTGGAAAPAFGRCQQQGGDGQREQQPCGGQQRLRLRSSAVVFLHIEPRQDQCGGEGIEGQQEPAFEEQDDVPQKKGGDGPGQICPAQLPKQQCRRQADQPSGAGRRDDLRKTGERGLQRQPRQVKDRPGQQRRRAAV